MPSIPGLALGRNSLLSSPRMREKRAVDEFHSIFSAFGSGDVFFSHDSYKRRIFTNARCMFFVVLSPIHLRRKDFKRQSLWARFTTVDFFLLWLLFVIPVSQFFRILKYNYFNDLYNYAEINEGFNFCAHVIIHNRSEMYSQYHPTSMRITIH